MPKKNIKISELTPSDNLAGLWALGSKIINGVQTSVRVSFTLIQTAYEDALKAIQEAKKATEAAGTATKKADEVRIATDKVRSDTLGGKNATDKVRQETDKVRANTLEVKKDAEVATKKADDAAIRLNDLSDHRDEIRDGYWWRWNEDTGEWYNTGEIAKGNVMYATFDVDENNDLYMFTDEEYTGPGFVVEEENLFVTLKTE